MMAANTNENQQRSKIDRLMDAIELVKMDNRQAAYDILRALIHEDSDFEEAWLWMAVAVDNVDQSSICLDNVLRVNPNNIRAAGALFRLRETEMQMVRDRNRLRFVRDLCLAFKWASVMILLYALLFTYML